MNAYITVWNRFRFLPKLCEQFTQAGLNVILIDNQSTYEPCVKYLESCPYKVIRMKQNETAWAFFITELYQEYRDKYFLISDSDLTIDDNTPSDWLNKLVVGLELHKGDGIWKCGLSQRIDNLPNNPYANEIKAYEAGFYANPTRHGYYKVWMDLGIAVYDRERRGEYPNKEGNWYAAVRTQMPYTSIHHDWFLTPETMTEEDKYYLTNSERKQDGWLCLWERKYGAKI